MTTFRSIEIDIDIHKCIETARARFDETPNEILHRLLKLKASAKQGNNGAHVEMHGAPSRSWSSKGVTLPHGTQLRMEYNGKGHVGQIDNGEWLVEGTHFNSPSAAAGGVARTRAGKPPSLDGWVYWHVKRPGDARWIPLAALRDAKN
jgi:hypothetical protein